MEEEPAAADRVSETEDRETEPRRDFSSLVRGLLAVPREELAARQAAYERKRAKEKGKRRS